MQPSYQGISASITSAQTVDQIDRRMYLMLGALTLFAVGIVMSWVLPKIKAFY